jgi:hypothetical protein
MEYAIPCPKCTASYANLDKNKKSKEKWNKSRKERHKNCNLMFC